MKETILLIYKNFEEENTLTAEKIIECCDSVCAVLSEADLEEWLVKFNEIINDEDAGNYCDFWSATMVFMIEGKRLVCVIDSGGELASGEFSLFCDNRKIPNQFVIDSLDFTEVPVDDMYTGQMTDNPGLMRLIHQITN